MKKLLLTISLFLLPISSFAITGTPNTGSFENDNISITCIDENNIWLAYNTSGVHPVFDIGTCEPQDVSANDVQDGNFVVGVVHFVELQTPPNTLGNDWYNWIANNYSDIDTFSKVMATSSIISDMPVYLSGIDTWSLTLALKSGVLFGRSGESQQANQNGGSMLAAVGLVTTNAFNGVFPYLMLSVGVFIGFYIIQQIAITLGLRSEKVKVDKEQAEWSGRGKMEHEVNEFKKKVRSRRKRGLE
jgi:hypothetical protein